MLTWWDFTCIIPDLFFKVVQVLSHTTHCSGYNIYDFGRIMDWLVQSPNGLTLISYYPNKATTIYVTFWRTAANFLNLYPQPILVVKTCIDFIMSFAKGLNCCCWFWPPLHEGCTNYEVVVFQPRTLPTPHLDSGA